MSDTKHGWVTPRADGARARCGGPGVCATCNTEAMHERMLTGLFGAPGAAAPAQGDAQAVAWMDPDTKDVISTARKAFWATSCGAGGAAKAARYTRALGDISAAPAAGDARDDLTLAQKYEDACIFANANARDAARLDWLEQHDGRFYNKDRISSIVGTGFLVAGDERGVRHQTVRAAIDAAIAAQQGKGGNDA